LNWLVGRHEDQFEESTITGRTHSDDPTLAAVVLLSNAENVAPAWRMSASEMPC
jgi:hypothetical protein